MNCISECVLNVLNDSIALTGCDSRNLHKHKSALRQLVDKQVPLSDKKCQPRENVPRNHRPFSRGPKAGVSNRGYVVHGNNTEFSASELYYNPAKPWHSRLRISYLQRYIPKTSLKSEHGWNIKMHIHSINLRGNDSCVIHTL